MYHRVLPAGVDTWRLNVSPEHFAEQLQVLRARAHLVSLTELVKGLQSRSIQDRSVAVTFDDGYANNLELGLPVLQAHDVPATVFVTTGHTDASREFWWDELEQLIVHRDGLPRRLELAVGSWHRQWDTGPAAEANQDLSGTAPSAPKGSRVALYYDLWQSISSLSSDVRRQALGQVRAWSGRTADVRGSHRTMTSEELATLAASPLMELGTHTVTHPRLTDLPTVSQRAEMADSRARLEQVVNKPVTTFSYPFGAWAPSMRALARDAGLQCAATCVEETVWHASDPFALPRFMVEDWDGAEFERRLSVWLK